MFRIGFGSDIHRLVPDRPLVLGGVRVESDLGAEGHSDADVLTHAITDAVLGALALGDIGTHFPNTDERWRNSESFVFLRFAIEEMKQRGFEIGNVDATVHLEKPKLREYIDEIRKGIAGVIEVETGKVSVKAKTGENIGSVGTRKAIKAEASVLIQRARQDV